MFTAAGIQILLSPPQAPKANAICERMIGTLRRELLDRLLILGEHHLRQVLTEYVQHYNTARRHCCIKRSRDHPTGKSLVRARSVIAVDAIRPLHARVPAAE